MSTSSEVLSYLKINTLFNKLDEDQLDKLARLARYRWVVSGDKIVAEGEEGNKFYLIKTGTVQVKSKNRKGESVNLAELAPGAFFGEVAVFNQAKRTADVIAKSDLELYEFDGQQARAITDSHAGFQKEIQSLILSRSKDAISKLG